LPGAQVGCGLCLGHIHCALTCNRREQTGLPLDTFYKGRVRAALWSRRMLRRIRRAKRFDIYVVHKEVQAMWRDVMLLNGPFVHSKLRRYVKLMGLEKALRRHIVSQVHLFVASNWLPFYYLPTTDRGNLSLAGSRAGIARGGRSVCPKGAFQHFPLHSLDMMTGCCLAA